MRLVTDAVLGTLQADWPDGGNGERIGDGQAPEDQTLPYATLYSLDENDMDGSLASAQETGWFEFQITAVGQTRMQAAALGDKLRETLLASSPTVVGYTLGPWLKLVSDITDRDDDVQPPVFYSINTLQVFTAPS